MEAEDIEKVGRRAEGKRAERTHASAVTQIKIDINRIRLVKEVSVPAKPVGSLVAGEKFEFIRKIFKRFDKLFHVFRVFLALLTKALQ